MMDKAFHPLDQLNTNEIKAVATAINEFLLWTDYDGKVHPPSNPRFSSITLKEPPKAELLAMMSGFPVPPRQAQVIFMIPASGRAYEATVKIVPAPRGASGLVGDVMDCAALELGTQPCLLSPDDCALAESIVKGDPNVAKLLKERYGITDTGLLDCDPWSYHVMGSDLSQPRLGWSDDGVPLRLVQTFLYTYLDKDDNHYAQPLDILPVVDLNSQEVVHIDTQATAPKVPQASVKCNQNKISRNAFAPGYRCADPPKPLKVVQPDGPSFRVQGNAIRWQKWSLRVGFNNREGLVVHDARFDGRPVMWRGSLVEMAVPYGDPREPFIRKCTFNAGDYGLGFCAESLELGCDSVGSVGYFDAVLNDSRGQPYVVEKAVCMHEEDDGILWKEKHADYRNGHNASRRSRRLVLSFIATVMNYEYLFYWYFMQDGRIEFATKLSGELSTNLISERESVETPGHGVIVAPGVNAQVQQHNFCARLDMSVDGYENAVKEVDIVVLPQGPENTAGNAFGVKHTPLLSEMQAQREAAPHTARSWVIQNNSSINPITGRPVSYKLLPQTYGPTYPAMVTDNKSAVTSRGVFATRALWVTQHSDSERWPAGDFTVQSRGGEETDGLPAWTSKDRNVLDKDVVLWHSFGLVHVPRVEDFPVIPCESTGFTLKPDGFLSGNPNVDFPPARPAMTRRCFPFE